MKLLYDIFKRCQLFYYVLVRNFTTIHIPGSKDTNMFTYMDNSGIRYKIIRMYETERIPDGILYLIAVHREDAHALALAWEHIRKGAALKKDEAYLAVERDALNIIKIHMKEN